MSLKEKITSLLFSSKQKEKAQEENSTEQVLAAQEGPESAEKNEAVDQTVLELPSDHPLNRLYNQRRRESGYLASPRICLDEDGVLPPELVQREKIRLRTVLTSVCSARAKAAKGKDEGRPKKKKDAGEEMQDGPPALDALPYFFLSADKLYAWLIVFPPVGAGEELSREMVYQSMAEQGIAYGVDMRTADRLYRDEKRYFNLFLIARGKPAFDGKNGNIVDYFPRVLERMLEVDEYDQVDYTALNLIRNVKQGQEICRLILPTEGEPGRTVLDQEIPAKSGKAVPLPAGRNTEISEDGVSLLASIAGHVEFTGRSFQVKPVLDIDGNVDFSTGSINFLGDINVKGDVLSGFTVRAMGNIQVGGVIEAGSTVEAGGDLAVVKGILGDGSTVVRSQRSVFAKYIENSTLYVRENLQTDCIINGRVYCDGEVQVRSGRGSIMGGRIWAAKKISAKTVGSQSECRTAVALGGLPCTNFEREIAQQKLKNLEMELEKLECQPDNPVKTNQLSKIRVKLSTAELKLRQLEDELAEITAGQDQKNEGRLECGIAYAGTEISFGEEMLRLRRESRQCIAKLIDGEIVLM
ncbi:MAG: DUF342 domain-containing protein [Lawsonibacter sp.]|nr:DUF342 domain-containing protein [Lawsonibacter sp.]